jgi:hypothetical protein
MKPLYQQIITLLENNPEGVTLASVLLYIPGNEYDIKAILCGLKAVGAIVQVEKNFYLPETADAPAASEE